MTADPSLDTERVTLADDLAVLERTMSRLESSHADDIALVRPEHRADAVNLTHYLALRQSDERSLQRKLGRLGLSSLGRCEPHVLATVASVRAALDSTTDAPRPSPVSFEAGRSALDRNTDALFGPRPPGRVPRVMVTLPSEAASDYDFVRHLITLGMDVAWINGAHDGPEEWVRMSCNVRKASDELGRPCRISMDLPGPKMRTGPLVEGPKVVRLRPQRDLRGVSVAPAQVELTASTIASEASCVLSVDSGWLERREPGDVVELVDTRGSHRQLHVSKCSRGQATALAWDTTYIETGSSLSCDGESTIVGYLPPRPQHHLLCIGDRLMLTESLEPAEPWRHGQPGIARIGCTLPAAFTVAQPGQKVLLDDGKLIGVIENVDSSEIAIRIDRASAQGTKLRAEKGINLPGSELPVNAVTDADLPLLRVAAAHADMVAVSFLRHERDVDLVREYLGRVGAGDCGLILKIETGAAFTRLPEILLHAMRSPLVGVMIARGDLAVEAGYERLAELQEEILWLCEAAHLPVIWATEVLDHLARTGHPSRAEVTDAAMAQRAECVMLNKGPHLDMAIILLDDILRRMSGHQRKKTALLRPLNSWGEGN